MVLLIGEAKKAGVQVRAGIQCAFGCVYEGMVPRDAVFAAAQAMVHAGADEINLADTTGMGNPRQVRSLVREIGQRFPGRRSPCTSTIPADWGWPTCSRAMKKGSGI